MTNIFKCFVLTTPFMVIFFHAPVMANSHTHLGQTKPAQAYFAAPTDVERFIMALEGLRVKTYKDIAGHKTIGYGHKLPRSSKIKTISYSKARYLLRQDIAVASSCLGALRARIAPKQHIALTSFIFNVGCRAYKTSKLRKALDRGNCLKAIQELNRWVFASGKRSQGLVNRRAAETLLMAPSCEAIRQASALTFTGGLT